MISEHTYPVLYSFRRCPYAMRARLAIIAAQVVVEMREIELRNKPQAMLIASPKGTVPVLHLADGKVIDESLGIMYWALEQNDPDHWMSSGLLEKAKPLIAWNDGEFKYYLDRYKYADRYPENTALEYRRQGERFLEEMEQRLTLHSFLCGNRFSLADAAIAPFIRQFAAVDAVWFSAAPYPFLRQWLSQFLNSQLFNVAMTQYIPWSVNDPQILFGFWQAHT